MPKTKLFCKIVLITVCYIFSASTVLYAGGLSDFEKAATKDSSKKDEKKKSESKSDSSSFFGDIIGGILGGIAAGAVEGVVKNAGSGSGNSTASGSSEKPFSSRGKGEGIMPYVRLDLAYQKVKNDISDVDGYAELGYSFLAVSGRFTHYTENDTREKMDTINAFVLCRGRFDFAEIGLGLGVLSIKGKENNSGISATIPVKIYPWENIGLEFKSAFSSIKNNSINDFDLGLFAGIRYMSVKAGYRWFSTKNESLSGPYAGLSFRY